VLLSFFKRKVPQIYKHFQGPLFDFQNFCKTPSGGWGRGGGQCSLAKISRRYTILGFIAFLMTTFLKFCLREGGLCNTPFTLSPPVCIYVGTSKITLSKGQNVESILKDDHNVERSERQKSEC